MSFLAPMETLRLMVVAAFIFRKIAPKFLDGISDEVHLLLEKSDPGMKDLPRWEISHVPEPDCSGLTAFGGSTKICRSPQCPLKEASGSEVSDQIPECERKEKLLKSDVTASTLKCSCSGETEQINSDESRFEV